MSHFEIIKLLICLENTGTLWWMTQYGNSSRGNNVEEYKNIYHRTTCRKKSDLEYFICYIHFKNSSENKLGNLLEGKFFLMLKEIVYVNMKEQLML